MTNKTFEAIDAALEALWKEYGNGYDNNEMRPLIQELQKAFDAERSRALPAFIRLKITNGKQFEPTPETDKFSEGQCAHYTDARGNVENGMVKTKHPTQNAYWVVYKCADNWDNYRKYTAALTVAQDLKDGWVNL
jgi:hypothetical protein